MKPETAAARAAIFEAPNKPFAIRLYPLRDCRPDEVLVRVRMATICRSDIHSYEGKRPNPCPGILGHEIVGIIEQMGSGIAQDLRGEALKPGDRITWTMYFSSLQAYHRNVLDMNFFFKLKKFL